MIGLVVSLLAFLTAALAARTEPRHGPFALALLYGLICSGAALFDASLSESDQSPIALLILLAIVSLEMGWAYQRAWHWRPLEGLLLASTIAGLVALGIAWPERYWDLATWGPIVASAIAGGVALTRWWRGREQAVIGYWARRDVQAGYRVGRPRAMAHDLSFAHWSFTQRVALVLLAGDVAGMLFARWPDVYYWQGRAIALLVTGMQGWWLWQRRRDAKTQP